MRLLFDENLSRRLVGQLADLFPDSRHVGELDLLSAVDDEIWHVAGTEGFAIVTKDDDFVYRALLHGPPPKVIWLQIGNCPTGHVETVLRNNVDRIFEFRDAIGVGLLTLP